MSIRPFNGPPMHGRYNTFISAMVRLEVSRYFFGNDPSCDIVSYDNLARAVDIDILNISGDISYDWLALFVELSRSCSPEVSDMLVFAIENEIDERDCYGDTD